MPSLRTIVIAVAAVIIQACERPDPDSSRATTGQAEARKGFLAATTGFRKQTTANS